MMVSKIKLEDHHLVRLRTQQAEEYKVFEEFKQVWLSDDGQVASASKIIINILIRCLSIENHVYSIYYFIFYRQIITDISWTEYLSKDQIKKNIYS